MNLKCDKCGRDLGPVNNKKKRDAVKHQVPMLCEPCVVKLIEKMEAQ